MCVIYRRKPSPKIHGKSTENQQGNLLVKNTKISRKSIDYSTQKNIYRTLNRKIHRSIEGKSTNESEGKSIGRGMEKSTRRSIPKPQGNPWGSPQTKDHHPRPLQLCSFGDGRPPLCMQRIMPARPRKRAQGPDVSTDHALFNLMSPKQALSLSFLGPTMNRAHKAWHPNPSVGPLLATCLPTP